MNRPVQQSERFVSLDVVRGVAVLAIAMLNALLIAYPQHFYVPLGYPLLSQADKAVELSLMLIVRSSFYPIFSFLFGAGFALHYFKSRSNQTGSNHTRSNHNKYFLRRYGFLLVIGLVHGCLIWMGDILTVYSFAAFILLYLARFRLKIKLLLIAVLTVLSFVMMNYGVQALLQVFALETSLSELLEVYANGSFWEVTLLRSYEFYYFGLVSLVYVLPQLVALFLLGMVAVEVGFFRHRISFKPLFIVFAIVALFKLPRLYFASLGENPAIWRYISVIFAGPALGGVYVLATMEGLREARASQLSNLFADAGRMALTNYLSQSIILTTIFYGYGLGQYAKWGSLNIVLLALGLYIIQMLFSKLWLQHFKYGPFEWLWRCFSYGRWFAIKKQ